jgi:thiazole/oxazole-forming peptide maturase SagD family component
VSVGNPHSIGLSRRSKRTDDILSALADPLLVVDGNPQGMIVISGAFKDSAEKYGNRSLLYVPLEAGHAAQNVLLAAVELKIGAVEIGGFLEDVLQRALGDPSHVIPLTTIFFGASSSSATKSATRDSIEFRWAAPNAGGYRLPFAMAFARPGNQQSKKAAWACGRSQDYQICRAKARSEAYEWDALERPSKSVFAARFGDMDNAIDPRDIVGYHVSQYRDSGFPYRPFSYRRTYDWQPARDHFTGSTRYVLADCVYYRSARSGKPYTGGNTSGTAAYPTIDGALERATLELIERDAFMIYWLNALKPPLVARHSLPLAVQRRLGGLESVGITAYVANISLDLAPVVLVFAQSDALTFTTCSAACSFEIEDALEKALMEVEASVYCRLHAGPSRRLRPAEVRHTSDHGAVYEQPRYFKRADHFKLGNTTMRFGELGKGLPSSWDRLETLLRKQGMELLAVSLDGPADLNVVKTFIPGLVPMHFGYREEALGMKRLYALPRALGMVEYPASYTRVVRFPHPYT